MNITKCVVSMRDTKAETWSVPHTCENVASAIREFALLVNSGDTLVSNHPEDFQLWQVAAWDSHSGKMLTSPDYEHCLGTGVDVKKA